MLEHETDADTQDDERAAPLHLAVAYGKTEAVQLVLEHGASMHTERRIAKPHSRQLRSPEIMESLREHVLRQGMFLQLLKVCKSAVKSSDYLHTASRFIYRGKSISPPLRPLDVAR